MVQRTLCTHGGVRGVLGFAFCLPTRENGDEGCMGCRNA